MQITVNGKSHACAQDASLVELVAELGVDVRQVALEVNGAIVPRSLYGETGLSEGDVVEIVQFIGGG